MPSHPTPSAKSQQAVNGAATHVASVRVHMYVFRPGRGYLRQRRVRKPNDMCAHPELLMDLLGLLEHFACGRTSHVEASDTHQRAAVLPPRLMMGLRVSLFGLPPGAYRRSHGGFRYGWAAGVALPRGPGQTLRWLSETEASSSRIIPPRRASCIQALGRG